MFNNFFSNVFTHEELNHFPSALNLKTTEALDNIVFTEADVLSLLRKLNVTKPPRPDNIHPRVLKECADELVSPLYTLFRASLSACELPHHHHHVRLLRVVIRNRIYKTLKSLELVKVSSNN